MQRELTVTNLKRDASEAQGKRLHGFGVKPFLIASLSLVPGVGHWVLGKRGKAVALFVVDFGMVCSVLFFRSQMALFITCFAYLMVMIPAVIETYVLASGGVSRFSESKAYIVVLLLTTGFSALPLLWQSHSFSKRMKIAWSAAVAVLAVLFFSFLGAYGVRLFHYVKTLLG